MVVKQQIYLSLVFIKTTQCPLFLSHVKTRGRRLKTVCVECGSIECIMVLGYVDGRD